MSGPSNNRNEYGRESSVASLRTSPADYSGLYIKKQGRNNGMKLYFRSMYSLLMEIYCIFAVQSLVSQSIGGPR